MYYSQIIPKLSLSTNVMTDIRDNVAVGRTVTVHEKTIHYKGWKGSGYIIIDPQTGSGAYLIDGGANGSHVSFSASDYLLLLASFLLSIVDTSSSQHFENSRLGVFSFSVLDSNKTNQQMYRISPVVAFLGFYASIFAVYKNDDLTTTQRIGQLSINSFAFFAGMYLSSILLASLALTPLGIFGLLFVLNVGLSILASYFNSYYFSNLKFFKVNR